ncbi:MAG: hypothetical protein GEU81_00210 [Nitriliruptorales bacterium]|nr:hypothetical protein [Nitriliruptorales bacterium]
MRIEELDVLCRQAAHDLVERETRPLPPAVVVPLPEATSVTTFPGFPNDDRTRFDLLTRFAAEKMRPVNAPAFGFLAEATMDAEPGPVDVVVVVYGARRHHSSITAAPLTEQGLGEFLAPEELEPTAFPFLAPLRHAVDAAQPPDAIPT